MRTGLQFPSAKSKCSTKLANTPQQHPRCQASADDQHRHSAPDPQSAYDAQTQSLRAAQDQDLQSAQDQDLFNQGGLITAFMRLASDLEESTAVVATGIRHIADVLDLEKRGSLSARSCGDRQAVKRSILDMVQSPMLDDLDRQVLSRELQEILGKPEDLKPR